VVSGIVLYIHALFFVPSSVKMYPTVLLPYTVIVGMKIYGDAYRIRD